MNWVIDEWFPIIGTHGMSLYDIYKRSANKERGNSWFFSLKTLNEYTGFAEDTIVMHNELLKACGLINIHIGTDGYSQRIFS
jgi:replication initiation and membrane attachment protein DnaB